MTGWRFWIDRGGTFTDIVAQAPGGERLARKYLSENPGRYADAAIFGIRDILGLAPGAPIAPGAIVHVRMGTTVATNALLERRGVPVLLVVNQGLGDLLMIGNQARPRLFDLDIRLPGVLYRETLEISARVAADGGEIAPLDEAGTLAALRAARARGLEAVAIALIHAWKYPEQEQQVAALARAAGFTQVSTSHETGPLLRLVPRGQTTVADAYLSPILRRYVDQVADALPGVDLFFMQSHGGLARADRFAGRDAVLSGPAGGIVGAARTAAAAGFSRVIGFDMGGTSTDVALYDGHFERTTETEIAGVRLRVPMLAIHTVAAGGGSILGRAGARLTAGPESAGANPGPLCYRQGGPLTVTDANLLLGRIQAAHFPAIFGPGGDEPLDRAGVEAAFAARAAEVAGATGQALTPRDLAEGYVRIAVAHMASAIREITTRRGHDVTGFALACFGGAGGQHACLVAEALGMTRIFIHPLAGVLSAYGMGLADQSLIRAQAVEQPFEPALMGRLASLAERLAAEGRAALQAQGAAVEGLATIATAEVRLAGTDAPLPVPLGEHGAMLAAFRALHAQRFGFPPPDRPLILESLSVEVMAPATIPPEAMLPPRPAGTALAPLETIALYSGGRMHQAPVYDRAAMRGGDRIAGPALIREENATTVIEPGWAGGMTEAGGLVLERDAEAAASSVSGAASPASAAADPVLLELFHNLFMSIAEQAGVVLQNASLSVNIKERLDFSCALFDGEGRLIANAPHVPVHLGAMGESVRHVIARRGPRLRPGDSVALNDPYAGGTHLPDITVVTPIFDAEGREIRFFTANRGHHADIGGTTPGSTPPDSRSLVEEGVVIDDFLLVSAGRFQEEAFRALLAGARHPARSIDTNIADIAAQIAANQAAAREMARIEREWGWPLIRAYMDHLRADAAEAVRRVIDGLADGRFVYRMDDGAPLVVSIRVDRAARRAVIDFTGTGPQNPGNFNAPPAVTRAVVLYVFRCLIRADIPLNDGCLEPLDILIPPGSFLAPAPGAAVVAGNTEVSQAVAAALLGALGVVASSQATMNNLLFGDARRQYYETICGGAGAGPGFEGASAVHTHMTNTRMTDPEILELRYPVRVEEFARRAGSGGPGRFRGGDGVRRRLRFLEPMTAVIVASRRSEGPFGLAGGAAGAPGRQWVERADGRHEALGGRDRAELAAGEVLGIETPGGGGYGRA
ncbi:hydantoinase B/oxoprolinase family protein [Acidisoma sp. C75]